MEKRILFNFLKKDDKIKMKFLKFDTVFGTYNKFLV